MVEAGCNGGRLNKACNVMCASMCLYCINALEHRLDKESQVTGNRFEDGQREKARSVASLLLGCNLCQS